MSKIADETLFKLIHDFLVIYLPTQRNSSPNTIRAYKTSLEMLLDFIKEYNQTSLSKVTFRMLDRKAVSAFLTYLEAEKRCCISTRNHRLKCIKAFLKYAAMVEPSTVIYQAELSKIPLKKEIASPSVEYMSENAVSILLKEPDTSQKLGIRNQFFMILAYDTGARVQELVDLRLRDIRLGKTPTAILKPALSRCLRPVRPRAFPGFRSVGYGRITAMSRAPATSSFLTGMMEAKTGNLTMWALWRK